MIVITGGAGFIGSCIQESLYRRGIETAVIDWLGSEGKWRNLAMHTPDYICAPEDIEGFLHAHQEKITHVIHMGAISETTATDGDLVWETNVSLSSWLWQWCAHHKVSFIYASSAATYGAADSPEAFSDAPEKLDHLKPLNLYGWSKFAFDHYVFRQLKAGHPSPPQWAGLKFFNVYGPNEYHKGKMISVIKVKYDEIIDGLSPRLFRSDQPHLANGMQARDFIWVGDVVQVVLWFIDTPHAKGLYNCGTGKARTYLDLAHSVLDAVGVHRKVEFIDMPQSLKGQYQNYTCADMKRLHEVGYNKPFTELEEGIRLYVQNYLSAAHGFL